MHSSFFQRNSAHLLCLSCCSMEDHTESGFSADRSRGGGRLSTLKATSCLCPPCASSPSAPVSGIICYEICALSLSYRSVGARFGWVILYVAMISGVRRLSIASFSFLPAFPTEYTTSRGVGGEETTLQHCQHDKT